MADRKDLEYESEGDVLLEDDLREPPMYAVYLHNDNYTTMDFVVRVLQDVFYKTRDEAEAIMLAVHRQGRGKCGIYTKEIAETKVQMVRAMARARGCPLKCTMEEDQ